MNYKMYNILCCGELQTDQPCAPPDQHYLSKYPHGLHHYKSHHRNLGFCKRMNSGGHKVTHLARKPDLAFGSPKSRTWSKGYRSFSTGDSTTHEPNVSAIYKAALVISLLCGCTGSCFGCKLVIASAHSGEAEGHGGGKAEGRWIETTSQNTCVTSLPSSTR